MSGPHFLVVAGSTRPVRRSPAIARWVATCGEPRDFRLVDLNELSLGLDDEPGIPAKGVYTQETTRRWSAMVSGAAGVVIVTPQYNWGYPAALKNAIDHLYREWRGKPVALVTYGGRGGDKCATQLREVFTGLDARLTLTGPALRLPRARIEADDGEVDPDVDFRGERETVVRALGELADLAATTLQPDD